MDKQIEEYSDLALIVDNAIRDWQDRRYACNEEGLVEVKERLAEFIAAKVLAYGYRKQVEGEWLTDRFGFERSICSVCGATFEGDGGNFCRRCGAKMKGEKQ